MIPYVSAFRRKSGWFPILVLCLVPSATASFFDGMCTTGTAGPCPGSLISGIPTGPLSVPEGFGQTILPVGVFVVPGDVLVFDNVGGTILGDVLRFPDIGALPILSSSYPMSPTPRIRASLPRFSRILFPCWNRAHRFCIPQDQAGRCTTF